MSTIKVIDSSIITNEFYLFEFNKGLDALGYEDEFKKFIKAVERLVRSSKEYKFFKESLFDKGLDRCMILGKVDNTMADIEMHHGPYLTLYDVCAIVVDHLIHDGRKVNTEQVAQLVLDEHFNGLVQVTMLSQTIHDLLHDNKLVINPKQSYGNITAFLKKYHLGINKEYATIIMNNRAVFKEMDTYDAEVLIVNEDITRFNNCLSWHSY